MKKEIKSRKEYYVEFTDEECNQLDIKEGDKFLLKEEEGGIFMEKYATMELDLSEFSREALEFLISESTEKDITVSEVVEDVLTKVVENYKNEE
jgi:hypothetical protein